MSMTHMTVYPADVNDERILEYDFDVNYKQGLKDVVKRVAAEINGEADIFISRYGSALGTTNEELVLLKNFAASLIGMGWHIVNNDLLPVVNVIFYDKDGLIQNGYVFGISELTEQMMHTIFDNWMADFTIGMQYNFDKVAVTAGDNAPSSIKTVARMIETDLAYRTALRFKHKHD